jgi:hypothetical protein
VIHWLETAFRVYFLHPLTSKGYQWWSGAGSDLGYATLIATMLHRHNCHKNGCWRIVRHGHTHCRKHEN